MTEFSRGRRRQASPAQAKPPKVLIALFERRASSLAELGRYKTPIGDFTAAIEALRRIQPDDHEKMKWLTQRRTRLQAQQRIAIPNGKRVVKKGNPAQKA